MIIRCLYCKREFEKPSHLKQHVKDAHPDPIKAIIKEAKEKK